MERKQFTFYESFFEAISRIRDLRQRAEIYDAICAYALREKVPDTKHMSDAAAITFCLIKPVLDAGRQKAANGVQRKESIREAKRKQNESKSKKENETENELESELELELELETEGEGEREGVPAPLGGESAPPSYEEVLEEANRQGCPDLARSFYDYYQAGNWRDVTGRPVQSWPQKLTAWRFREDSMVRKVLGPTGWAQLAREMDGVQ